MYNQRKQDKCHCIAAFGGETGAGSVEGRGLFAGATVAGIHAEVSERDGRSLSFRGSVYYGVRSNIPGKVGADGSAKSVMSWGLHIPTLGHFGYFESDFDFSNGGVKKANDDALEKVFADDPKLVERVENQRSNGNTNYYSAEDTEIFRRELLNPNRGFEEVKHIGEHGDGVKYTYRKKGSMPWTWGQIEFVVRSDGSSYASYNYGNNPVTHFVLDLWGYRNRGYK